MTKHEINKQVSELREPSATLPQTHGFGGTPSPKFAWYHLKCDVEQEDGSLMFVDEWQPTDWHSDMNWPTLLREMPMPELYRKDDHTWGCRAWASRPETARLGDNPGEAVCRAYLAMVFNL